jgi:ABC-type branched-subunit amino acid transport system permease subunit
MKHEKAGRRIDGRMAVALALAAYACPLFAWMASFRGSFQPVVGFTATVYWVLWPAAFFLAAPLGVVFSLLAYRVTKRCLEVLPAAVLLALYAIYFAAR